MGSAVLLAVVWRVLIHPRTRKQATTPGLTSAILHALVPISPLKLVLHTLTRKGASTNEVKKFGLHFWLLATGASFAFGGLFATYSFLSLMGVSRFGLSESQVGAA